MKRQDDNTPSQSRVNKKLSNEREREREVYRAYDGGGWWAGGVGESKRFLYAWHHTHDVDQLYEGEAELDVDGVGHVLHWPDELVVAPEEIAHQPLLILGAQACKHKSRISRSIIQVYDSTVYDSRGFGLLTDAEYRRDEEEPDEPRCLEQHPAAGCVSLRPPLSR